MNLDKIIDKIDRYTTKILVVFCYIFLIFLILKLSGIL